jgi:hypothetical protein
MFRPRCFCAFARHISLIATLVWLQGASVAIQAAPPVHPGWPSTPVSVNAETPVAADIDGDGKLEILWGRRFGVSARHEDGSFVTGWPAAMFESPTGPPAVAKLDGAAIVGMLSNDFNVRKGQVSLWRGDATPLPGWPKEITTGNHTVSHQMPLVLADVDGDGRPEVIYVSSTAVSSGTAVIHVDRIDGTPLPGWPVTLPVGSGDIFDGSPAVADVDGDGRLDLAVGSLEHKLFLFHDNGVLFPGWPRTQGGDLRTASVSFADINGDAALELVATTAGGEIAVYDTAGNLLPGWPRGVNGQPYPPAFADLENDGTLGVINNDTKLEMVFGTLSGGVYVLRSDGTNFPGWPKTFPIRVHSVALADINSDSKVDLLATDGERNVYAWNYDGTAVTGLGFPFQIPGSFGFYSGPIVSDIDGDGLNEFFALGEGYIHVWDLPTTYNPFLARYPDFMGDVQHRSRYAPEPTIFEMVNPVYAYTDQVVDFTIGGKGFLKGMRAFIGEREQTVSNVTATSLTITADNVPVPVGSFALYPLRVSNVNSGSSEPLTDAVWVWRGPSTPPPTPTPTPSPTPTPRPTLIHYSQAPGRFGGASDDGVRISVADDFELAQDTAITRVRWWGGYSGAPPMPDSFTLRIFVDESGHPGDLIQTLDVRAVDKSRTGLNSGAQPEFEYSASLRRPFMARGGARYWLSIVNPPGSVWLWEASHDHTGPGSRRSFTDPVHGPWEPHGDDFAFQLESVSGGLGNISTRAGVGTGDNVLIAGFIITGNDPTRVLIRALGPSLSAYGVSGALADPVLGLHDSTGQAITSNNDWNVSFQTAEVQATGLAPPNNRESAIVATLNPNTNYTAVISGLARSTGIAVAEVYDLNHGSLARLANISTRGLVQSGDDVMIGGFIIRNPSGRVIVRALGPSLQSFGITNPLPDPFLELHDSNGALLASNDSWRSNQEAEIIAPHLPPSHNSEAAIVMNLPAGAYTGIIRGANTGTGVGLIEVYDLD